MRVVNLEQMREIERKTFHDYQYDENLIVENVGHSGATFLSNHLLQGNTNKVNSPNDRVHFEIKPTQILFFIGCGNNGADGLAMARHLYNKNLLGLRITVFQLYKEAQMSEAAQRQLRLLQKYGVRPLILAAPEQLESYLTMSSGPTIFIDAIFGTGVRLPLPDKIFDLISVINTARINQHALTFAIDIASGVSGETGQVHGNAIQADFTLAVGLPKLGHFIGQGGRHSGLVEVIEAGFPLAELQKNTDLLLLNRNTISYFLPNQRDQYAHKNNFGHVVAIGGGPGLCGALTLASLSSQAAGAGLVTAVTWEESYQDLVPRLPASIMSGIIPESSDDVEFTIKSYLSRFTVAVCGPGMGRGERSRKTVLDLLSYYQGPVVLDADAINVLNFKDDAELFKTRPFPTILTPHIGEFARFMGVDSKTILERPMKLLTDACAEAGLFIVLKDACTLIGSPDGRFLVHYRPNHGMAKGGSGDILAGLIAGLLGQEFAGIVKNNDKNSREKNLDSVISSLALAVYIHGEAGHLASEHFGPRSMSALNLVEFLPEAFKTIDKIRQFGIYK